MPQMNPLVLSSAALLFNIGVICVEFFSIANRGSLAARGPPRSEHGSPLAARDELISSDEP
jgi:hypothetical protein